MQYILCSNVEGPCFVKKKKKTSKKQTQDKEMHLSLEYLLQSVLQILNIKLQTWWKSASVNLFECPYLFVLQGVWYSCTINR